MGIAVATLYNTQPDTKIDWKQDWKEDTKMDFLLDDALPVGTMTQTLCATIDPIGQGTPNCMWIGNLGQVNGLSATEFIKVRNETYGIELAMRIRSRSSSVNTATMLLSGAPGELITCRVPALAMPSAYRLAWQFDYSVVTGISGTQSRLSDFEIKMLWDMDPTTESFDLAASTTLVLNYAGNGNWSTTDLRAINPIVVTPDAGMTSRNADRTRVEQDSSNLGFDILLPFLRPNLPANWPSSTGTHHLYMIASIGGQEVAAIRTKIMVVPGAAWI